MRSLPPGNYALSIAHPGHELRLHGFLEQAKPFVFILTDGSQRTGQDMMFDSIKVIDKATKRGKKITIDQMKSDLYKKTCMFSFPKNDSDNLHLKDLQVYYEIVNQRTEFFISFIDFIATTLLKYKTDYLISDSSEGYNVCHEMTRIMADIAIALIKKKTGKEIFNYDFAIEKPYNDSVNEDCIRIESDDEAIERKLDAIVRYPLALTDLKPNVSLDYNMIIELGKMPNGKEQIKEMIKEINFDFLKCEYLRPYTYKEPSEKTVYEINGEKAVVAEKYFEAITWHKHLKPLKQKLEKLILGNEHN